MTDRDVIPGIEVTDLARLKEWMESEPHRFYCNAWSEGQWCCLDKLIGEVADD